MNTLRKLTVLGFSILAITLVYNSGFNQSVSAQLQNVHVLFLDDFLGTTLSPIPDEEISQGMIALARDLTEAALVSGAIPACRYTVQPFTDPNYIVELWSQQPGFEPDAIIVPEPVNNIGAQFIYNVPECESDYESGYDIVDFVNNSVAAIEMDFGQPIRDKVQAEGGGNLCAIQLPEFALVRGQAGNYVVERGGVGASSIPHGEAVVATFEDVANNFAGAFRNSIEIHTEDSRSFSLTAITEIIEDYVQRYDHLLINASFAIIPCMSVPTFGAYVALLQTATDVQSFRVLVESFIHYYEQAHSTLRSSCGLHDLFEEIYSECEDLNDFINLDAIVVAAAGNLGLPYSFYPGAFDNTISTSMSNEDSDLFSLVQKAQMSNSGEILMPGISRGTNEPLLGTSFAAPRLSFFLAVYLTQYDESTLTGCLNADRDNNGEPDTPDFNLEAFILECYPLANTAVP